MRKTGARLASTLLLSAASLVAAAAGAADEPAVGCREVAWLEIHKAARTLRAWCDDGEAALEMRIALGRVPEGTKRRRGDGRTPEGVYRVIGGARESRFHLFLPLDYPSRADAAEALAAGRIGEATYARILAAHRRGVAPPQDTPLGGHLGLHGQGARWQGTDHRVNWTRGCVGLRDDEIEALAAHVAEGTPVFIYP